MPYYRCPACGLTSYSAASHSTGATCSACAAALPEDATNSVRHARPHRRRHPELDVVIADGRVCLAVHDGGAGFEDAAREVAG